MGFILNQINFSPIIVDTMKKEFLLALFCATLAEGGRVQHHLRCWAINGWEDRAGMDQWCMDNCLTPAPWTNCPSTTSDGGGCDCNCDAGDDGCPLSDDATTKTKLFRLQKKTHKELRVQRRAHKTNQKSKEMVRDISVCPTEADCMTDLLQVLDDCSADPSVFDNDSMMACIGVSISDDCHDCVCEAYAEEGFSCP